MAELRGEIKSVIFRSEDTGYTVLDVKTEVGVHTVVGTFPPVSEGQNIRVEGSFQTKTLYGKQFFAENVYVSAPSRLDGIRKFLGSGLIRGLGPVTAEAIVAKFGVDSLEKMKYPFELAKVKGISLKRATEFGLEYTNLIKMQDAMIFLQELGVSINLALKIYGVYGGKTEEVIRKNPYTLIDDVGGIGFASADRIAESLGISRNSDYRITAGIKYVLKKAATRSGHTYLPENELLGAALELLRLDCDEPEERVRENVEDMIMFGDLIRYDTGEHAAISLKQYFNIEESIARRLAILSGCSAEYKIPVDEEIRIFENEAGFKLHPNQVEAVKASIENGVHIVTGGPGTGKTTIVKCILHIYKDLGQNVSLCAPTGRAAKRMSEATGEEARTIHRLLELDYKDGTGRFKYDDETKLSSDVVIVDEMSMVDEYVFSALVRAVKLGARLVLVGDKDQLASVGAGNVLGDLIACGKFKVSYLTQIYRQSEDSKIITNAHKINHGEMPILDNKSKDFFFEERENAENIARTTIDLVTKRLTKYLGVDARDVQVLCPMKRGSAGVVGLNQRLQAVINPPSREKKEFHHGETLFREGDKVMQTQNNYQQEWTQCVGAKIERGCGVYNGDIGTIESINLQIMQFIIRFDDDKVAVYKFDDAEQLTLAYAVTIHKSQGCEFDAVVIALDANYMLQSRNLLYTAVTRAKKIVVIAGTKKTLARMVKNNQTARRYSLLVNLVNDEFASLSY